MASKVKPIDIKAEVCSSLKLALKATGIDLGEGYDIEKSQKELFFDNLSIEGIEHKHKCFRPIKVKEQVNETDTEFHAEKAPAIRTGSTGQEVKGSSESSFPSVMNMSTDNSGLMHRKSNDNWVDSEPIPARSKLRQKKGYDTYVCKVEVSLRVPSLQVGFYVKKGISTKMKTIPARDVLSKLKGWDESKDIAMVEVTYDVEAEYNEVYDLKT